EDYRAQVERISVSLARVFHEDTRITRVLLLEAPSVDEDLRNRVLDFFEGASSLTAAYLAHGVKEGFLRADLDVPNTGRAINGMILAAILAGFRDPATESARAMSD